MTAVTPTWLPSLGMTGFYTLAAPYTPLLSPTTQYTCSGVVSLASMVAQGLDPLSTIYLANGDTKANYQLDLDNNRSIITLTAGMTVVEFPSSAMKQMPNQNGVIYRNTVLGIALSAVPDYLDLTTIQTEIQTLVLQHLGVATNTFLTTVGNATVLTGDQDAAIRSARQANIVSPSNDKYLISQLQSQNLALQQQIKLLEAYILANAPPPIVTP